MELCGLRIGLNPKPYFAGCGLDPKDLRKSFDRLSSQVRLMDKSLRKIAGSALLPSPDCSAAHAINLAANEVPGCGHREEDGDSAKCSCKGLGRCAAVFAALFGAIKRRPGDFSPTL